MVVTMNKMSRFIRLEWIFSGLLCVDLTGYNGCERKWQMTR